ncbi:hypothetical protein TorRG33x02_192220, partial [Trema orientale]
RNGSMSTPRHHVTRGADLDAPTGHIETWRLHSWHSEHGWTSPELEAKYELEGDVELMRQALISKNIMPPSSRPHVSDQSWGPSSRFCPNPSHQSSSEFVDETH